MLTEIQHTKAQVSEPKIWDFATAKAQVGDYIRVPFVPVMCVVDRDELSGGQVWLLLKPTTASYTEEWVLEMETDPITQQQPEPLQELLASKRGRGAEGMGGRGETPWINPGACTMWQRVFLFSPLPLCSRAPLPLPSASGLAGDSISSQLLSPNDAPQQLESKPELTPEADPEFQQGRIHGQHDAAARLHPIYTKPNDAYAAGYMSGYSSFDASQQPRVTQRVEWSVTYNQKWGWYDAWVGHRWIVRADSHESAERMATKRIATDEIYRRQNAAVMRAYAA